MAVGKHIWVDADACPVAIKEILFRASQRLSLPLTLIANQPIAVPKSPLIRMIQVPPGFDVADDEIVKRMKPGDLVITQDIPLAAEVIAQSGDVLSPRGERLTQNNIGARLSMRDFMSTLRSSGIETGGPPPLSQNDRKIFADQLDRWLSKAVKTP